MYYALSIGSDLSPEKNVGLALEYIIMDFNKLYLLPVCYTESVGLCHESLFVNTIAIVKTDIEPIPLKDRFVKIEIMLGRDRSDPLRSVKSRTCDIDIMGAFTGIDDADFTVDDSPYLKKVINSTTSDVEIRMFGLVLPKGPTSIYLEAATSDERIVNYEINTLYDWMETAVGR